MKTSVVRPAPQRSGTVRSVSLLPPRSWPAAEVPVATTQGTLALDFSGGTTLHEHGRPQWQLISGRRAELDAFARRFCAAVVEVIGGDRGPRQLLRWTTEGVYEDLVRRSTALTGATPVDKRLRKLRAHVRSVHLCCPSPTSAELSVHVRHGHRSRALAARLEQRNDRWVCVALEFG